MIETIKVSDYIVETLAQKGASAFFGVQGGAVAHLFDSIERCASTSAVYFNHEQSASFALQSYSKVSAHFGVGIFTTGPGATNAITGLAAAWLDSIPCLFISGQVRNNSSIRGRKIRQVGTQEIEIIPVIESLVKYAKHIRNADEVPHELQKALTIMKEGRPGPVWLDLPVDISWTNIEKPKSLLPAKASEQKVVTSVGHYASSLSEALSKCRRPLFLLGRGCTQSGMGPAIEENLSSLNIPFVTTWGAPDILPFDHPLNCGRVGLSGHRGANFAVQCSDFLLCLGTHLNNSITGTLYEEFAPNAKVVVMSNDRNELDAININVDVAYNCDLEEFLPLFFEETSSKNCVFDATWLEKVKDFRELNEREKQPATKVNCVNSIDFKKVLSASMEGDAVLVADGGGTNHYSTFLGFKNRDQQKIIVSSALGAMGSGIPEAIGVFIAMPDTQIVCTVGDGSIPFNMQELQVIKNYKAPIKIFVLNNKGYTSIRTTQADFLGGLYAGSDEQNLHLIDTKRIADAFDIAYEQLDPENMKVHIEQILSKTECMLIDVPLDKNQEIVPRQGFEEISKNKFRPLPLHKMYPVPASELVQTLSHFDGKSVLD